MISKMKINLTICEIMELAFSTSDEETLFKDVIESYSEKEVRHEIRQFTTGATRELISISMENFYKGALMNVNKWVDYAPDIFKSSNGTLVLIDSRVDNVFKLFIQRNWNNYCVSYNTCKEFKDIKIKDFILTYQSFFNNVLDIISMTQGRYLKLLDMYQATTTELLAKLVRSSSGSADNKTFTNMTPQTPATTTEDWFDHVNTAVKNLSSASDTTSEDKDYLIDKINAIQEKYRNVLKDWSNELDRLCWESEMK